MVDEAHRLKNNQSKVRKHSHTLNPKQIKYSTCTLIEELLSPSHSLQWLIFTPCISGYVFEVPAKPQPVLRLNACYRYI